MGRPKKGAKGKGKQAQEVEETRNGDKVVNQTIETLQNMSFSSDDLDLGEEVAKAIKAIRASPVPESGKRKGIQEMGGASEKPRSPSGSGSVLPKQDGVVEVMNPVDASDSFGSVSSPILARGKLLEAIPSVLNPGVAGDLKLKSQEQLEAESKSRRAWNDVVKGGNGLVRGQKLQYIPPRPEGVVITEEEYNEGSLLWKNSVVGYVLGLKPGYKAMQKYVSTVWKKEVQIHQIKEGVFLFRFYSEADMEHMMATRWSFSKAPFIVQKWNPKMKLGNLKPDKVAIWVRFSCLELQYWSTKILSKMASYIGIPLQADLLTVVQGRLGFARVLIEIGVNAELPDTVPMITEFGNHSIPVVYEWYPAQCSKCTKWGHKEYLCPQVGGGVQKDRPEEKSVEVEGMEKVKQSEEVENVSVKPIETEVQKDVKEQKEKVATMKIGRVVIATSPI